jgi:hypothetical protein
LIGGFECNRLVSTVVAPLWTRLPVHIRLPVMKVGAVAVVLLALSVSELASGQQEEPIWKEFTYPSDGFALSAPAEPKPHDSPALPGATAYVVQLGADTGVVLKAKTTLDCSGVVPRLKESILAGKDASVDQPSLKDLSLDGQPGLEYRRKTTSNTILERWYCVDGHLYIFSVTWPSAQPFPDAATRVLKSFRLVAPKTR